MFQHSEEDNAERKLQSTVNTLPYLRIKYQLKALESQHVGSGRHIFRGFY